MARYVIPGDALSLMAKYADDHLVSYGQAVRLLRVSQRSVLELIAGGAIPTQEGVRRCIRIGDLREFKIRQRAAIREISEISEALGHDE
jgi:hypothetical protein